MPDRPAPADADRRTQLKRFAEALNGFLGDQSMSIQVAGKKLEEIEGFREAMARARMTSKGSIERFIRLFPEFFEVQGTKERKRVARS